jgi:hypothetical protein
MEIDREESSSDVSSEESLNITMREVHKELGISVFEVPSVHLSNPEIYLPGSTTETAIETEHATGFFVSSHEITFEKTQSYVFN